MWGHGNHTREKPSDQLLVVLNKKISCTVTPSDIVVHSVKPGMSSVKILVETAGTAELSRPAEKPLSLLRIIVHNSSSKPHCGVVVKLSPPVAGRGGGADKRQAASFRRVPRRSDDDVSPRQFPE